MAGQQQQGGSSVGTSLSDLMTRSRRLAVDFAHLAVLDARYTVRHIVEILCVAVIASVLVVSAWLALVAAATGWLLGTGTSWPAALMLAAAANLVAAFAVGAWLRQRQKELPFTATLRQLRGEGPRSEP